MDDFSNDLIINIQNNSSVCLEHFLFSDKKFLIMWIHSSLFYFLFWYHNTFFFGMSCVCVCVCGWVGVCVCVWAETTSNFSFPPRTTPTDTWGPCHQVRKPISIIVIMLSIPSEVHAFLKYYEVVNFIAIYNFICHFTVSTNIFK